MNIKCSVALLSVVAFAAASPAVMAQAVNFQIKGEIQAVSCTPIITGIAGGVLLLPKAKLGDLNATGKTFGDTTLTFAMTGCNDVNPGDHLWAHFESDQVDTDGRIIPTTGTAWVRFEVRDVDSSGVMGDIVKVGGTPVVGSAPGADQGSAAQFDSGRNAGKSYVFRYYATQALTQLHTGAVGANAKYTLVYY